MANSPISFRTAAQLDVEGFYPVMATAGKRESELYLPLYEGKMVQPIRSPEPPASVRVNPDSNTESLPGQPKETTLEEPTRRPELSAKGPSLLGPGSKSGQNAGTPVSAGMDLGFRRHCTAPTNARTMIAADSARVGCGHTPCRFFLNQVKLPKTCFNATAKARPMADKSEHVVSALTMLPARKFKAQV